MEKISFVIPCYCSSKTITEVVDRIENMVKQLSLYDYEVILVNDCSKDNTSEVIFSLSDKRKNVKAIDLAKNVGQHGALMAGMNHVDGDYIVTLDDDGQTPIENLPLMLETMLDKDYDVVTASYIIRNQHSVFRRFGSWINNKMTDWLIDHPEGVSVSVFLLMKRFVNDEMIKYKEPYPFVTGLVLRVTHNIGVIPMEQSARVVGTSGYTFRKLLNLWLNGFTSFSIKPLRIATFCGSIIAVTGLAIALIVIIRKLFGANIEVGWSSVFSAIMVLSGIILIMLGLIGEYLGRIYLCINHTPQYTVKKKKGFDQ